MKKINSIHFGLQALCLLVLFIIIIPLLLTIAGRIWAVPLVSLLRTVSWVIGGFLFLGLSVVWVIECKQDKRLNTLHLSNSKTKTDLGNGRYECQHCGFQGVGKADKRCPVCTVTFEKRRLDKK